jgi:dolichol-phosphate mannosyltransferase
MSADGQDPPELINNMLRTHFEEGYEIVVYTREGRDESRYRILTSRIFYSLMRRLSFPNMPAGGFDFVLVGRKALEVLLRNQETHPFFQGQVLWLGFRTKFLGYRRRQREAGQSRWTFARKLTYLIDGVLSYSFFPIRAMSLLGIAFALLGFLYAVVVFVTRLFFQTPMKGWAPLMIVVLMIGGFQMLMLGVIGEYVWRTLAQVRSRDPYVIEAVYEDAG